MALRQRPNERSISPVKASAAEPPVQRRRIHVGKLFSGAADTTNPVQITISATGVTPSFARMTSAGLCQINLTIPSLRTGNVPIIAAVGGAQTQSGMVIALQLGRSPSAAGK
jgi:uncharacterized protein (TIGR03437 family)